MKSQVLLVDERERCSARRDIVGVTGNSRLIRLNKNEIIT